MCLVTARVERRKLPPPSPEHKGRKAEWREMNTQTSERELKGRVEGRKETGSVGCEGLRFSVIPFTWSAIDFPVGTVGTCQKLRHLPVTFVFQVLLGFGLFRV